MVRALGWSVLLLAVSCNNPAEVSSSALPASGSGGAAGCTPKAETCNHSDDDCDGVIDNGFDADGDGFTTCGGDCDDRDATVHAGAAEVANGKDDNCDGKVDNRIAGRDFDRDGTAYPADCNDEDALVSPEAVEVAGDKVDNNCNGQIDEPPAPCDTALTDKSEASFAKSMGICQGVVAVKFLAGDPRARTWRTRLGDGFKPQEGSTMVHLSTGAALDLYDDPSFSPGDGNSPGTDFGTVSQENPEWTKPPCGCDNNSCTQPAARDLTHLQLTLKAPPNAKSFSYKFAYFSAEYSEYLCQQYDDRFIAVLTSQKLKGNISFDGNKNPVTVNNNFFQICRNEPGNPFAGIPQHTCKVSVNASNPGPLKKTGYDIPTGFLFDDSIAGGSTGWLETVAPVTPGEQITLDFYVFDEGDGQLDSAVLLDGFSWQGIAVDSPSTAPIIN